MNPLFNNVVNFIRNVYNTPDGFIPLHSPVFIGNEKKYLEDCIDSTYVSSVGKYVDLFEEKVKSYTGAAKAVACVNGTSALHLALNITGVKPDTEVITQPLTFIATTNAISYCGARPIFLDVDKETMGLSPAALDHFLKKNSTYDRKEKKVINKITKKPISACVPMHTFGHPCKIDEISEVCDRFNIPLIEDAAESLGSFYKAKHTGTFGRIGVISFNGNKIITTGGGGMLLFQDEELAKHAKHLSTQSKIPHPWEFNHDEIGYNYRLPNINAALGIAQLEKLDVYLKSKFEIAQKYSNFFNTTDIEFFSQPKNSSSNYWLNCIFLKNRAERDEFLAYTNAKGIGTRPCWTLMSSLEMYKNCYSENLINAGSIEDRLVNIPSSVTLI